MNSEQNTIYKLKDIAEGLELAMAQQEAALQRMKEIFATYERNMNTMLENMNKCDHKNGVPVPDSPDGIISTCPTCGATE